MGIKNYLAVILFFVFSSCLFGNQVYVVKAPEIVFEKLPDGSDAVRFKDMPGHYVTPGYPDLPCSVFRYALPPDIIPESITVGFVVRDVISLGLFDIKPVPEWQTGGGKKAFQESKEYRIYDDNAFYPRQCVENVGFSQMRKWNIIGIRFNPLQYNPRTKELRYIKEAEVTISYLQSELCSPSSMAMQDSVMDERAVRMLSNFSESAPWYGTNEIKFENQNVSAASYNYVIITTNRIKNGSKQLNKFMDYLRYRGFSPLLITEDTYDSLTGQAPNGRSEKIRQWLKTYYLTYGIKYVLLIGNPDPSSGDLPMKMCWPRHDYQEYRESPTDYFYADLTGNWDLNGDRIFGSIYDQGGFDFINEVYVGRIPVYDSIEPLDKILNKTIRYGVSPDTSWRSTCILAAAIIAPYADDAYWAQWIIARILSPANFSCLRMYQKGNKLTSEWACDYPLTSSGSLRNTWSTFPKKAGVVLWSGHGSSTHVALGFNNQYGNYDDGDFFGSSDTTYLNDNYPSFVFQCSCLNGYPETSNNLGVSLLKNGAIATVASSRVSWVNFENYHADHKFDMQNRSIAFCYAENLIGNRNNTNYSAAQALFEAKDINPYEDRGIDGRNVWMNAFDFNLYGDPSLSLGMSGPGAFTIVSPNGGESYLDKTTQTIRWTTDGDPGARVTIEYSADQGFTWNVCADGVLNIGTYDWTIPQGVNSTTCLVRVRYTNSSLLYDTSDDVFTIVRDNPPTITINSPQNNQTLYGSTTVSTNATDDFGVTKVEFYINNSKIQETTSSPFNLAWDALAVVNGTYEIKATAYDRRNQTASSTINVSVKNILVELSVSRESEKAWMVKREYGKITLTASNPANITGVKFLVYRNINGGAFEKIQELSSSLLINNSLTFKDKYLDIGSQYGYRIDAVDSAGKLAGKSAQKNL